MAGGADDRSVTGDEATLAPVVTGDEATLAPAVTGDEATLAPATSGAPMVPEALPIVARDAYAVAGEVGRGGLGRVLRAHDHRLRRTVAVKEMLAGDADAAARFVREAMVTARLQHPSIVSVYEAGRWPTGEPFYAMKLVSGRPLDALIREAPDLAARLALLPHLLAVAEAMAYAHGERVIHRDLKPSNVLVGAFGETVVIDWGLAKDLADRGGDDAAAGPYRANARSGETIVGAVMGTPAYMPPEQARGERVDERADVYALAAMLYHVMAGKPPFAGASVDAILEAVLRDAPPPLRDVAPGVPPDLAAVVAKGLAREPGDRYPTAKEMADELRRFQTGQLVAAHRYSRWTLARRWMRRHRGALSVAAAALVAIAALSAIGVARIVSERNRAVAGEAAAASARDDNRQKLSRLYEEQGRQELLAGHPQRALLYLAEAFQLGDRPSLRFLLARARPYLDVKVAREMGVDAWMRHAAWSRDGTRVVTLSTLRRPIGQPDDNQVRIWDAATGTALATIDHLDGFAGEVALAPDAREVLFSRTIFHDIVTPLPDGGTQYEADNHGEVVVFDAATGAQRRTLALGGDAELAAWADGGHAIVTLDGKGGAIVWDDAGAKRATWPAKVVAVSPDGAWIYVGDAKTGSVRDAHTLATRSTWTQTAAPADVWFSRDGDNVFLHAGDTLERRSSLTGDSWETIALPPTPLATGQHGRIGAAAGGYAAIALGPIAMVYRENWSTEGVRIAGHERPITSVDVSADGARVLTASEDGTARVWDAQTGRLLAWLDGHEWVEIATFSPDGAHVLTAARDGKARIWDVPVRAAYADTATTSTDAVASWAWSPDGKHLAMASGDDTVGVWDATSGVRSRALATPGSTIVAIAWSPDGTRIVGASGARVFRLQDGDGTARVWDAATGKQVSALSGLGGEVTHAAWGAAGARVITEDDRAGTIEVWDVGRGAKVVLHGAWIHPDAALDRALVGDDRQVRVIDLASGRAIATLAGVTTVSSATISADGRLAFVASTAGPARVFDAGTGAPRVTLADADGWTQAPVFSPDGRALAGSNGDDGTRVWDAATGALRVSVQGHSQAVTSIAWSPDGALFATTSMDRSAKIWDAANGSLLASLDGHEHWVLRALWSPDGAHLAAEVARAWVVRMWDVHHDTASPAAVAAQVRCAVPFRLVEGRPLPAPIDRHACP